MDVALRYIARDDFLRSNDGGEDGGWYIVGTDMECKRHLPSETLQEIMQEAGLLNLADSIYTGCELSLYDFYPDCTYGEVII